MKDMWDIIDEMEKQKLLNLKDDLKISEFYEIQQLYQSGDNGCKLSAIHAAFEYGYLRGYNRAKHDLKENKKEVVQE